MSNDDFQNQGNQQWNPPPQEPYGQGGQPPYDQGQPQGDQFGGYYQQPAPPGAPYGAPQGYLEPHHGGTILTLGILGIIAWVMGQSDLEKMRAGRMDRSGEGMTQAGRILGIIATILWAVGAVVRILILMANVAAHH